MDTKTTKQNFPWMNSLTKTIEGIIDPLQRNEMERLDDRCTRVLLVARTRWIMLSVLVLYAVCAAVSYSVSSLGFCFSWQQTSFLLLSVGSVVIYNAALSRSCNVLRRFSSLIHVQIALDLFCVTVMIHFTGGIVSWFWPVYLLVTLESVFLYDDKRDVWLIGTLGAALYGALLLVEGFHVLNPISMPFIDASLYNDFMFQMLQWLWVAGMNATVALIGAFLMDVLRRDQTLVKESEEALLGFINSANDLIFCCGPDGNIIFSNSVFREVLNIGHEEQARYSLFDFVTEDDSKSLIKQFDSLKNDNQAGHIELQLNSGGIDSIFVEMSLSASSKGGGISSIWGVCRDITERKHAQHELYKLAHHDVLTGLPNRVLLEDRLQQAKAFSHRTNRLFAVLYLDLDRFKIINDTLGHSLGDELLRLVAERLRHTLRETDTIARIGGDEFIILLPSVHDHCDVANLSDKILKSMMLPFNIGDHELFITTSLGGCLYPNNSQDLEDLLKKADIAMYHAKSLGRNNFQFYNDNMDLNASRRFVISNSLRRGLEQNEFRVHYQPKVDVSSGRIVAMEALARWEHPELGLLSPVEFIQLAEENGLIMQLGEWVLRESCIQNVKWQSEGIMDLRVAVNLSGYQLQHSALLATISRVLKETGMSPDHLELEITESVLMQNPDFAVTVLSALSESGIQISIDDFGTGYSSLAHLKRFSVNTLKIDKSFVRDVDLSSTDAAIATAIIAMGNSLNLNVIAEGVETQAQFDFLKFNNCDQVQGYHFCRPLPPEELIELLRTNHRDMLKN
ncbi:MAG: EAL domain-containing protein [Desulfobacteraceae bacterium]|nr:EAL domain-containing protein [Desulfobacteraceae bacterium]